jgi:nucleotide-binding universal stress UspA family protein
MSTSTITEGQQAMPVSVAAAPFTRILIATDGLPRSDVAVTLARDLARRDRAEVDIAIVYESIALHSAAFISAVSLEQIEHRVMSELREFVHNQRMRTDTLRDSWIVRVESGYVPETIEQLASEGDHELVVIGLGKHGAAERYIGPETALQLMRRMREPVLAVASGHGALPRRVLLAVDFSESSVCAGRNAVRLLGTNGGTLVLAHVTPRVPVPHGGLQSSEEFFAAELSRQFDELERALGVPDEMIVTRVTLHGDPAAELLRFARENEIELIATGSHGRSAVGRMILGSVSTRLVRGSSCSVLVTRGS